MDIHDPIKEIKWMRLGDVIHNPGNWKNHPQAQREAVTGAVKELGFGDVVKAYWSERTGGLTPPGSASEPRTANWIRCKLTQNS